MGGAVGADGNATTAAGARLRLGARVITVTGAYAVTAVITLLVVYRLRQVLAPTALHGVLSFVFIAVLSAGLEPGTVKAAALRAPAAPTIAASAYLIASVGKAFAAAPVLALLWWFTDPGVDPACWLWLPLVTAAGFAATDLRVLADLRGRHAAAIWLKQGGLAIGVLLLGVLAATGVSLFWAIGLSTLPRLLLVLTVLAGEPRGGRGARAAGVLRGLYADPRWLALAGASAIAALSGSADRVLALRMLAPAAYGAYYLLYEALTKFWLLPYLLTPIIFARQAAGGAAAAVFLRWAWRGALAAGAGFLLVLAAILLLAPGQVDRLLGARFGWWILAFAGGVVLGAFSQLRIAQLQGEGRARRAMAVLGISAVLAVGLFWAFLTGMGARGLLLAWLVRFVIELGLTFVSGDRDSGRRAADV